MLATKILGVYLMVGVLLSIPLGYTTLLSPNAKESSTLLVFLGRTLLIVLLVMHIWPVIIAIFLSEGYREAKKVTRCTHDHCSYSRTSDAANARRLLQGDNLLGSFT